MITICTVAEAVKDMSKYDNIISLIGPDCHVDIPYQGEHHLIRVFHDFEGPAGVNELHGTKWETDEIIIPSLEICSDILGHGLGERNLIHCHAGRSRSTAAAIALLVQDGIEPYAAVEQVGKIRPTMLPNRLMTQYFAQLLGRPSLIRAVQDWYDDYTGPGVLLRDQLGGWSGW